MLYNVAIFPPIHCSLSCLANSLLSLYKHCKELSQKAVSAIYGVFPNTWECMHTYTSAYPSNFRTFLITLQGSYTVPVDLSQLIEVNQAMSPAQRASLPTGKGSSSLSSCNGSIQSSVEGLGKSKGSGEEGRGSGRRETKRKLLDALEPFAPKRRSSRVCVCSVVWCVMCSSLCFKMLTRRKDKDHKNYFEMLSKYLPSWFMWEN